ncbi:MAG: twin-arginine translocation signal domain-containing protein [Flexilinea sp.]|nr:twin-arginine translocation signal domain-containing protein [Flexilinea sp.]
MSGNDQKEKPEVYAIRRSGGDWQISRRDFLKAAGLGAAVMGIGMGSRFVKPANAASDLESLCENSPAHKDPVMAVCLSKDGKYLLSCDSGHKIKCWDFHSHALLGDKDLSSGWIEGTTVRDGKQALLYSREKTVRLLEAPDLTEISGETVSPSLKSSEGLNSLDIDSNGDLYIVSEKHLFRCKTDGKSFGSPETLASVPENSNDIYWNVSVLASERSLFLLKEQGYGVFDVQNRTMRVFDEGNSYYAYAILPGGAKALLCKKDSSQYSLVSLVDGSVIWNASISSNIMSAAVTPDGTYGILYAKKRLVLISMADGSEVRRLTVSDGTQNPLVVANDGTQLAAGAGKSILFISLPDFEIIGCPVDLKEMKDDTKGIEVKGTDPATGRTVTYTLPCGSPIPEGAVCVCNCVAGSVCSCVGHTVCTCDTVCSCVGNTICTCDTVCSCVGNVVTTGHYWHPN